MEEDDESDAGLLARLSGGDRQALAALFDRHAGAVTRYAWALAPNRMDVEEIVQDTFLTAWRKSADIRLPDVSGLQVCRHMQGYTRRRQVPILTMSAFGAELDPAEVRRSGADGFLAKPLRISDLQQRIESMVG